MKVQRMTMKNDLFVTKSVNKYLKIYFFDTLQ